MGGELCPSKRSQRSLLCLALVLHSDLKTAIFFVIFARPCGCMRARIIDQGLMCLIRSIDSNMADLGLHITLLPISRQALPSSAATCQNQLLVLQIGLCLFLYVFPVFEHLSVLFCSVLLFLAREARIGETQIPFGGSRSHCAAAQPAADRHQLNTPRAAAAA